MIQALKFIMGDESIKFFGRTGMAHERVNDHLEKFSHHDHRRETREKCPRISIGYGYVSGNHEIKDWARALEKCT